MEIKKFEAYKLEDEMYDDFAEEHAKVVIAKRIDKDLENDDMMDCLDEIAQEYDLDESTKGVVLDACENLLNRFKDEIKHFTH